MNKNSKTKQLVNFYGRDFIITPDVLIPRPETEMVIDAVLNLVGKSYLPGVKPAKAKLPNNLSILDVGTGSGCLAITLKLEIPTANISASDISGSALKVAKQNSTKFNTDITFFESDLLDNIDFKPDIIVANLPYVDETWDWLDKKTLSKEPFIALYAKDHGLTLIKKLITQAKTKEIQYIILESDPSQHNSVKTFAQENNYNLIETRGFIQIFEIA